MQASAVAPLSNNDDSVDREGSDTESCESEPTLTPSNRVVTIPDLRNAPPLPVLRKHAQATATAVLRSVLDVPPKKRTKAEKFALTLPLEAHSVTGWVDQQFCAHRKEHTLKTALVMALHPKNTGAWAREQTGAHVGHMYVIKGLALHLRMHPFTRPEVQHACAMLLDYQPKVRRSPDLHAHRPKSSMNTDALEVAVIMVLFQRHPRWYN